MHTLTCRGFPTYIHVKEKLIYVVMSCTRRFNVLLFVDVQIVHVDGRLLHDFSTVPVFEENDDELYYFNISYLFYLYLHCYCDTV